MPKVWIAAPSFAALGHLSPLAADREKIADRPLRESRCRSVLYRPSSLSCDQCQAPAPAKPEVLQASEARCGCGSAAARPACRANSSLAYALQGTGSSPG